MFSSKPCKRGHTPFTPTASCIHTQTHTHPPPSKTHTHTHTKTGNRHTHWGYSYNSVHCPTLTAPKNKVSKMVRQRSHGNNVTRLLWLLSLSANHQDQLERIGERRKNQIQWTEKPRNQNKKAKVKIIPNIRHYIGSFHLFEISH